MKEMMTMNHAKTDVKLKELMEEMTSITQKEMMACQETMEMRLEEKGPTSVETKPEVAQQGEVLNEDAIVKPVKGRNRSHKGKKQAAGQHGEPKKLTQGDCGSQMKLGAPCRKVSHHATVAWFKRKIFRKIVDHRKK
jgi:hypothetical protein